MRRAASPPSNKMSSDVLSVKRQSGVTFVMFAPMRVREGDRVYDWLADKGARVAEA